MPRGGARAGAGRPRKLTHEKLSEIELEKRRALAAAKAGPLAPGELSAVEIMKRTANALYVLGMSYRPTFNKAGKVSRGDVDRFRQFLSDAGQIAGKLGPFQGPTFGAMKFAQIPIDLSKLSDQELAEYARLTTKATAEHGPDHGRADAPADSPPSSGRGTLN